ncbi:MAG: protein phosphatase 2C domain-containing protein [Polyangiaceae bacterium]|nr:protein phosphatase 2C domain-containing protein [Polyangiaceae bacterium]
MSKETIILDQASAQVLPRCDFRIDYCAATQQGATHAKNEDAHLCRPAIGLFGIADGMGGHAAGDMASRVSLQCIERVLGGADAAAVLERYVRQPDLVERRAVFALLKQAYAAANEAVLSAALRHGGDKGMGSTLDVVLLVRDRAFFAHLGDSRAYLVRPMATLQLTHDHALYDSLQQTGKRISVKRWIKSPLARHIGSTKRQAVDTLFVDLQPGDKIILCTDGAYGALDDECDFGALCEGSAKSVCTSLIEAAATQGLGDDATVVTLRIGDRFVARAADGGPRAEDIAVALTSPLLCELAPSAALAALQAAVEVELDEGTRIDRAVASDRVAYIVLDGLVQLPSGRTLGASGLLFPESLLDVPMRNELPTTVTRARLLRIRHDDFVEVCSHDPALAAGLYQRLARHLATLAASGSG